MTSWFLCVVIIFLCKVLIRRQLLVCCKDRNADVKIKETALGYKMCHSSTKNLIKIGALF